MRNAVEKTFGRVARWLYNNRWKSLLIAILFVGTPLSHLSEVTVDTSTEGFLKEDDPALVSYNNFRERFGRDDMIIVAIKPTSIFDTPFLERLRAMHRELTAKVPHLDEVNSLINARNTRGEGDQLIVGDLLEKIPQSPEEMALFEKRVRENPIYQNLLVSEKGDFTALVIRLNSFSGEKMNQEEALTGFDEPTPDAKPHTLVYLSNSESNEAVKVVKEVVARYTADDFPTYIAGSPVMINELRETMQKDMKRFVAASLCIIALLLAFLFRRVSGVTLPILVVILSVLSTVGAMAWAGIPIKLPTQVLPSFLLAVSVGDSVHILSLFYYRLHHGDSKEEAIVYAMEHSGLAVLLTSLTTAAGLGSFATAEVAPIADLGLYAAGGTMLALLYTLFFLPTLIAIFPIRDIPTAAHRAMTERIDTGLKAVADFSTRWPKRIVGVSFFLMAVALWSASSIVFSHNPMVWLPEDLPLRQATEIIDHNLKGSSALEVIVDTGETNGMYDPVRLRKLVAIEEGFTEWRDGDLFIGKSISLGDMIREINRALHENRLDAYTVPDDKQLIAQEFLLFENSGSDDLSDVTDSQFSIARMTLKAPWLDAIEFSRLVEEAESRFDAAFAGDAQVTLTGMIPLLSRTLSAAMYSARKSYLIAGVVITLMMIFLVASVRLGLIAMIPNLFPIIMMLGVMGVCAMPMDMFTMLIGSIALGLAVDDTVHFMHNFGRYYAETANVRLAVEKTLHTAGRAMLVTSIVLAAGFFIFMFSSMNNLFNFGLLTGGAIITALLADFFLAPALMALRYGYRAEDEGAV